MTSAVKMSAFIYRSIDCWLVNVNLNMVCIRFWRILICLGLYLNLCATGLHPEDNDNFPPPYKLIEMPLRIFVLSAQVTAGMWRRNGYAIPNQVHIRIQIHDIEVRKFSNVLASQLFRSLFSHGNVRQRCFNVTSMNLNLDLDRKY